MTPPPPSDAPAWKAPRSWFDSRTVITLLAVLTITAILVMAAFYKAAMDRVAAIAPALELSEQGEESVRSIEHLTLAMEAAQRDYLASGRHAYRQELESKRGRIESEVERNAAQARDLGWQDTAAALDKLRPLIAGHAQALRRSMDERDGQAPAAAGAPTRPETDIQTAYEAQHTQLLELEETYERRLWAQLRQLGDSTLQARLWQRALFALAMLSLIGAVALALYQMRRGEAASARLAASHAGLESAVAQRTGALTSVLGRYRNLVELSMEAVVQCGPDRMVRYANPAAEALLNSLGPRQWLGQPFEALLTADERQRLAGDLQALWVGQRNLAFTASALARADGSVCPVELSAAPFIDNGKAQTLFVLHDTSMRMATQAALQDQVDFVEQLIEAVPLPLALRDTQGRFVRVNAAYERFHGRPRAQLIGRALGDLLPREQAREASVRDVEAIASGGPTEFERPSIGAEGQQRSVLVRQQVLRRLDGSIRGVLAVETDISALRAKEDELWASSWRLRELTNRLIEAQETERRGVARELHDQVGQILTALRMQLASAARLPGVPANALAGPLELADEALAHTRDLTAALHPHMLENLGLQPAVNWLLERYVRPTLPSARLDCASPPPRSEPMIELTAFRVVQEALTNVIRHADAGHVDVRLMPDEERLRIEISDDGEGFDDSAADVGPGRATPSTGMASMRERVQDIGGVLQVTSSPGRGTQVRVTMPWPSTGEKNNDAHPAG